MDSEKQGMTTQLPVQVQNHVAPGQTAPNMQMPMQQNMQQPQMQNHPQMYPVAAPMSMQGPPMQMPTNTGGAPRGFKAGLCDNICSLDFLVACCVPCITYGQNQSRLDSLADRKQVHPEGGDMCGAGTFMHIIGQCFGFATCLVCFQRDRVRQRYNISGNLCGDYCSAWCCHGCTLVQISEEVSAEEQQLMAHMQQTGGYHPA